jgi:predicted permease
MPPRVAAWIVKRAAGREESRFVLDDLAEEYAQIAVGKGRLAANRWYWRQALTSAFPLLTCGIPRLRSTFRIHLRDSIRTIARAPGLSAVIIVTLALGIGANAAVFSVVDALMIRPLPYSRPDRLVALWEREPPRARTTVAPGNFVDYSKLDQTFAGLAAYDSTTAVVGLEVAEEVPAERITVNLWDVLGVVPAAGRGFAADDGAPGAARVVIISDGFWQRRLGADPTAVGRVLDINRVRHEIVGIAPPTFRALSEYSSSSTVELFLPLTQPGIGAARSDRDLRVIGRLRDGVSIAQARAQLEALTVALQQQYTETNKDVSVAIAPLSEDVARNVRTSVYVVSGAVAVITLIGCVNVANLLLIWASGRRRDIAVRLALGAGRGDVLAESVLRGVLYGVLGGAAGIVLGLWLVTALVSAAPPSLVPRAVPVTLNLRVLIFAALLSLVSGLIASVVPAIRMLRGRLAPALRESSQGVTSHSQVMRWRGILLTTQITAAVVLAFGAGLLVRSSVLLASTDLGFATDRIVTMRIRLPLVRYADPDARLRFFEQLQERVARLPGAEAVAYANQFPMLGGWGGGIVAESAKGLIQGDADLQAVSSSYFATLGLPIFQGRSFTATDTSSSAGVVLVSRTLAEHFFPGESPIGRVIRRNASSPPLTVIGVVGEVRRDGKFATVTPQMYFSAQQTSLYASDLSSIAVRTTGDPKAIVPAIRQIVAGMDKDLVVASVRTLDDVLDASVANLRFHTGLLTLLAGLALTLSLVGVYGVVSHVVTQRTREISVRLALGASRGQVIAGVMSGAAMWTLAGIVIGMATAAAASKTLSSLLFSTTARDPLTFVAVGAAMAVVAIAAAFFPARRAAGRDPVLALRGD